MGTRYLVDTSVIIKYLNKSIPEAAIGFLDAEFDRECNISFITKIELLAWKAPNPADLQIISEFVVHSNLFYLSDTIVNKTIEIRKATGIKLPDCLIAATAIVNGLTLLADNDKDFNKIIDHGFSLINPNNI